MSGIVRPPSVNEPLIVEEGELTLLAGDAVDLDVTFSCGQAWGWLRVADVPGVTWRGVIGDAVVSLSAPSSAPSRTLRWTAHWSINSSKSSDSIDRATRSYSSGGDTARTGTVADRRAAVATSLGDFLHVSENFSTLVRGWSTADSRLAQTAAALPGWRVLRQDPWECLVSFICSSNNNVGRIGSMLARLRETFGRPLVSVGGASFYAFPEPKALAAADEAALRSIGMGYRAAFLRGTAARVVADGGVRALRELRGASAAEQRAALITLPGVGPKVADCVAVFSLDAAAVVPVDTHVWDISRVYYDRSLTGTGTSLTPSLVARVGALFRARFGERAGWAHSLLFAAELPAMRDRLPVSLRLEMDSFRRHEKSNKAAARMAARAYKGSCTQASDAARAASAMDTANSVPAGPPSKRSVPVREMGDAAEKSH